MNHLTLLLLAIATTSFLNAQELNEIVSERSLYSNMYLKNDGTKEEVISLKPVNYNKNGEWFPIDPKLVISSNYFVNEKNAIQTLFPINLESSSIITMDYEGSRISVDGLKHIVKYNELSGIEHINLNFNPTVGVKNDNKVTYDNVYNGYSDKYDVLNGEVKNNFNINSITAELSALNGGYFGFQERFNLPTNWTLQPSIATTSEMIHSSINILDENNKHVLTIPAPIFYDNQGMTNDGVNEVEGAFIINKDKMGWLLSTIVPVNWLKDPSTMYPVVIDPTVVLAGVDGGWQSQNNYVNNAGFVFIGVCCGNLEHRAWLRFNTASIPDASCVSKVELQIYVNGVGGAASELIHAFDMTGAFGPYGGVLPSVYADMANGYYTSFSVTGVGTYGYYDLGPSAAALLQSQLTIDGFQVALIFDNEPSINWKRLTAGLCNLRVSYDAPPCAPLPVGLVSFDAKCENDNVQLNWSTMTERNSDYFSIWKSEDGIEFEEISKIKSHENSTSQLNYSWIDATNENELAYYQLRQTDLDGTVEEFNTVLFKGCNEKQVKVFVDEMNSIHILDENITQIELRDNMGRVLLSETNHSAKNEIIVSDKSITTGVYSATIIYNNGKQKTVKFLYSK